MSDRNWVSRTFWAAERPAPVARRALEALFNGTGQGLNVGAGTSGAHPGVVNLDIRPLPGIDVLGEAIRLPFAPGSFNAVLSQETVEHTRDPFRAVAEMARVLKPGGRLFLQVPFVIGYHPDPDDYWRFTRSGVEQLMRSAGLLPERVGQSFGGGTGLHRIAVEFVAGLAGTVSRRLYRPAKGAAAIGLYPLKWVTAGQDRIAGGYFGVARKPN